MAKPVIKFNAVPYEVNGHAGYRPSFEGLGEVNDLDFCKEVVEAKRLQTSADQLLHDIRMLAEVASTKAAEDGRSRGITKLLKWRVTAKGNLESPTSAWNDTCRAEIRPQLLSDSTKLMDATFVNAAEGIGVKLSYVAWLGAQTVINVVKVGKSFAAYGNHMEWLAGDTAKLTVGTTDYALTCTESDVAHAVFSWPAGLNPESGTQATFVMKSRGGVEEGEVYTSKKVVTIIEGDVKKVIAISDLAYSTTTHNLTGTIANVEGVLGFDATANTFKADIYMNGGKEAENVTITVNRVTGAFVASMTGVISPVEGDTAGMTVHPNPAKEEYEQNDVHAECNV